MFCLHRESECDQDVENACKKMNRRNALILGIVALCLMIGIVVPVSLTSVSGDPTGNDNPTTELTPSTKIKIRKI